MKPVALARAFICAITALSLAVPSQARFLQVDTVGYDDQINLYAYVDNDPLNQTDPTGEGAACDFTPGGCGMRELTSEEEARRDEAYADVGIAAASFIPAERAFAGVVWAGKLLGFGAKVAPTLSQATRTALAGGRHSGLIGQFAQRSTASLQRTIRGLEKQISTHQGKIRNPAAHMMKENPRDPAAVQRAVKGWKEEVKNYSEQRDIAQDALKARETCGTTGTRICF